MNFPSELNAPESCCLDGARVGSVIRLRPSSVTRQIGSKGTRSSGLSPDKINGFFAGKGGLDLIATAAPRGRLAVALFPWLQKRPRGPRHTRWRNANRPIPDLFWIGYSVRRDPAFRSQSGLLRTSFFASVLAERPGRVDKQDSRGGDRTCDRCDCKQEECRTRERKRINR
jgi:hypothetical protein